MILGLISPKVFILMDLLATIVLKHPIRTQNIQLIIKSFVVLYVDLNMYNQNK